MPLYYYPWTLTPPPRPAPGFFESAVRGASLYAPGYSEEQERPGPISLGNLGFMGGEVAGLAGLAAGTRALGTRLAMLPDPRAKALGLALLGGATFAGRLPGWAKAAGWGALLGRYEPGQTLEERAKAAGVGAAGGAILGRLPGLRGAVRRLRSGQVEPFLRPTPGLSAVDRAVDKTLRDLTPPGGYPSPWMGGAEPLGSLEFELARNPRTVRLGEPGEALSTGQFAETIDPVYREVARLRGLAERARNPVLPTMPASRGEGVLPPTLPPPPVAPPRLLRRPLPEGTPGTYIESLQRPLREIPEGVGSLRPRLPVGAVPEAAEGLQPLFAGIPPSLPSISAPEIVSSRHFPAAGEQYDIFETLARAGTAGPRGISLAAREQFFPSYKAAPSDVGRLRQWLTASSKGRGPLAALSNEQKAEIYSRVYYGGEPLQKVIASVRKHGAPIPEPVRQGDPVVQAVREVIGQPVAPDALVRHPYYAALRSVVSKGFAADLNNPTMAASQADAYLAGLAQARTPEEILTAMKSLRGVGKRLTAMDASTLFATINRAFKVPGFQKISRAGRKGVAQATQQVAQAPAAVAEVQAGAMTIRQVLEQTDADAWVEVGRRLGLKTDSNSVLGLLALLQQKADLLDQPASMIPRLLGEVASANPNSLVETMPRGSLEAYLVRLFTQRIEPAALQGMPDDMLRIAVRTAETLLSEGHSVGRVADIAAMHLGAPSASRLLLLGAGGDVWKRAVVSGDAAPVILRALEREMGKYGMTSQEIVALAETIASNEGTDATHALGYLAFKAGVPVENIEMNVARQYVKLLQRAAGQDPEVAEFFKEMRVLQGVGDLPRGFNLSAAHTIDPQIDDLVPVTSRMVEEQGLIEDPRRLLQEIIGVGQQAMDDPVKGSIVARLEEVLNEMAYRRASVPERMKVVREVAAVLGQPEQAMEILSRLGRRR